MLNVLKKILEVFVKFYIMFQSCKAQNLYPKNCSWCYNAMTGSMLNLM